MARQVMLLFPLIEKYLLNTYNIVSIEETIFTFNFNMSFLERH
jgi:hypothetical protein